MNKARQGSDLLDQEPLPGLLMVGDVTSPPATSWSRAWPPASAELYGYHRERLQSPAAHAHLGHSPRAVEVFEAGEAGLVEPMPDHEICWALVIPLISTTGSCKVTRPVNW